MASSHVLVVCVVCESLTPLELILLKGIRVTIDHFHPRWTTSWLKTTYRIINLFPMYLKWNLFGNYLLHVLEQISGNTTTLIICLHSYLLLLLSISVVSDSETPQTAAHQDPVPGFSRQEHWSGSPFPSPVHESEKWKWSRSVTSDSSPPHRL